MKRFYALLILLISVVSVVKAEGRFGVRVSYELACPGDVSLKDAGNLTGLKADLFGNSSGLNISGVYNIPVFYGFYFEPGLTFAYNTYSINRSLYEAIVDESLGIDAPLSSASMRMWDLRIPLMGGYSFQLLPALTLSVFTGPELSLGMSSHSHFKIGSTSITEPGYGSDGFMNRTDVKWRFGVGATFADHFYGGISGAVGLCDRIEGDMSMKSNLFDITIGYNF